MVLVETAVAQRSDALACEAWRSTTLVVERLRVLEDLDVRVRQR
jgi:hypothetical protein